MLITEKKSAVIEKTEELCQTILEQPLFQTMQAGIRAFETDAGAQELYNRVVSLQDQLQDKQRGGFTLTPEEIREFEGERDALMANEVAKGYIDAQQHMHEVQDSVTRYVRKTLELGRMPTEADMASGCCGGGGGGGGCGCSGG